MAKRKFSKKRYLKALNRGLEDNPDVPAGARFVFLPLGAKAKAATGVAAYNVTDADTLALMDTIQAAVAASFANSDGAGKDA